MTEIRNSKIERHYFEQFRKAYALPDGLITHGDRPDIIICGTKKVGVEITRFFVKSGQVLSSEQRQRCLRSHVVSDAHRRYLASGGRKIELTFEFDSTHPIAPSSVETLAQRLAEFAQSQDGRNSGEFDRHFFRDSIPELSSIYVNAREYDDAEWRIVQIHSVGLMSKSDLQAIVRGKEAKAARYAKCDAYWLLVVVDGIDAAQEQEIRLDDVAVQSNVFEKIIVFHTFGHFVESQPIQTEPSCWQ